MEEFVIKSGARTGFLDIKHPHTHIFTFICILFWFKPALTGFGNVNELDEPISYFYYCFDST